MATVAVGDIHGNIASLEDLLEKIVPELYPEDTLVFLGDYIDRGPASRQCIDRLIRLRKDADFTVITLMGNHEQWMLRSRVDDTAHSWILRMEAFSTIRSYSTVATRRLRGEIERLGSRLMTEKVALPYHEFFNSLPPTHLDFFNTLRLHHRTDEVVCVHGGVATNGKPVEANSDNERIWGGYGFPNAYSGPDRIVYGHRRDCLTDETDWPKPNSREHTHGIDTIATGVLTAMRFPDLAVFQSGRHRVTG